jgi:hypothetical protein
MFLLGAVLTPGGGGLSFRVDDLDGSPNARAGLPVVVIGAGPVGLAAAAHLLERGLSHWFSRPVPGSGPVGAVTDGEARTVGSKQTIPLAERLDHAPSR